LNLGNKKILLDFKSFQVNLYKQLAAGHVGYQAFEFFGFGIDYLCFLQYFGCLMGHITRLQITVFGSTSRSELMNHVILYQIVNLLGVYITASDLLTIIVTDGIPKSSACFTDTNPRFAHHFASGKVSTHWNRLVAVYGLPENDHTVPSDLLTVGVVIRWLWSCNTPIDASVTSIC